MNKEKKYWKWKSTIIDFNVISDEKDEYSKYMTKKDLVFHYLGTPDDDIHEWYNGGYSSEYNTALKYAKELALVEDYIDYEEIRCENEKLHSIIKEAREYITKQVHRNQQFYEMDIENILKILDKVGDIKC